MAKQFRVCSGELCRSRMASLEFDGHSKCPSCIGMDCDLDSRCEECREWPIDKMKNFVRHKKELEKTRARKARRRQWLREQGKLPVVRPEEVVPVSKVVKQSTHNMSQSSSALSINITHDSLNVSSDLSSESLPSSSSAAASNPNRSQVITNPQLDSVCNKLDVLTEQLSAFFSGKFKGQVPCESVKPLEQALVSNFVSLGDGVDPQATNMLPFSLVEEGVGPSGDSAPTKSCPNPESVVTSRSRKRSREPKDSSARVKRTHPPSRERCVSERNVDSQHSPGNPQPAPAPRPRPTDTVVPRVSQSPVRGKGAFNVSMTNALTGLVKSLMKKNPDVSVEEAVQVASEHVRNTDPLNSSYVSSRSGAGSQRRQESILDVSDSSENGVHVEEGQDKQVQSSPDVAHGSACTVSSREHVSAHNPVSIMTKESIVTKPITSAGNVGEKSKSNTTSVSITTPITDGDLSIPITALSTVGVRSTPFTSVNSDESRVTLGKPKCYVNRSKAEISFEISASSTPARKEPKYAPEELKVLKDCFDLSDDDYENRSDSRPMRNCQLWSSYEQEPPGKVGKFSKTYSSSLRPWRTSLSSIELPGNLTFSTRPTLRPNYDHNDSVYSLDPISDLSRPGPSPISGPKVLMTEVDGSTYDPRVIEPKPNVQPRLVHDYCEPRPRPSRPKLTLSKSSMVIFSQHGDSSSSPGPEPAPPRTVQGLVQPIPSTISSEVPNPPLGLATQSNSLPLTTYSVYTQSSPVMVDAATQTIRRTVKAIKRSLDISISSVTSAPPVLGDSPIKLIEGPLIKKVKNSEPNPSDDNPSSSESEPDTDSDSESKDDLLPSSKAYSQLKKKIVDKYPKDEKTRKVDERSPYQLAHEESKPVSPFFKFSSAVKGRLEALDIELEKKKSSGGSQVILKPFLKPKQLRFYKTDLAPDTTAPDSLLNSLSGIVNQLRIKNFKSSKASFSMSDLESLFKSAFRLMQILSFASQAFEVLGDGFKELMENLSAELKPLALEHASFLSCVDKAGRHAIGESVNIFANLLIKKREHIMSLSYNNVPTATKSSIIFAPLVDCKLLPLTQLQDTVTRFRQQTEASALASVAAVARSQASSNLFRGSLSFPSSSKSFKGKQSFRGNRGTGGRGSGLSAKNREFFKRRDKFTKGRGQRKF